MNLENALVLGFALTLITVGWVGRCSAPQPGQTAPPTVVEWRINA